MKVVKTGIARKVKLDPPRMIDGVKRSSYDKVEATDVIRVDELVAWCNVNQDVPASTLALSIQNGDFV